MNEARSLTYKNNITDIYSNSWGPTDFLLFVDGPGRLTKLALQNGVEEVCIVSCHQFLFYQVANDQYTLISCRGVMVKVQFLYFLMVMEDPLTIVELTGMHPACTPSLLVPLE